MVKKKKCKKCGKIFQSEHGTKYCPECKNKKVEVKCSWCDKLFILGPGAKRGWLNGQTEFYCSSHCSTSMKEKLRKGYKHKKICALCKKEFMGTPNQKFCYECKHKEVEVKCAACGETFILNKHQQKRWLEGETTFYCPKECGTSGKKVCLKCGKSYKPKVYNQKYCEQCKNGEVRLICPTCKKEFSLTEKQRVRWFKGGEDFYCSCECSNKSDTTKQKAKDSYKAKTGYENAMHNPIARKKLQETIAANGNRSQEELFFEQNLFQLNYVDNKDFYSEYKDDKRYPFSCDFYIPKKDLFIELNCHWTHGGHWFDIENIDDNNKIKHWENKSKESSYYEKAINDWTIRDCLKREIAAKNKINYVVLWNNKDIEEWFRCGMPIGQDWHKEYSWKE